MKRIITLKRLREYADKYPGARSSLDHWEKTTLLAEWQNPSDIKHTFNNVDPVQVGSGKTVYVFNIERNRHRLIAAIHFNSGMVFVLRIMTHSEYDQNQWKDRL